VTESEVRAGNPPPHRREHRRERVPLPTTIGPSPSRNGLVNEQITTGRNGEMNRRLLRQEHPNRKQRSNHEPTVALVARSSRSRAHALQNDSNDGAMDRPRTFLHHSDERSCVRWDAAIAELADRQHGVVARFQLFELGMGRGAIDGRIRTKRLHLVYWGVYAVGRRRIDQRGVWMAAVLSCGPDAVLSHRAAAALWGIRPAGSGRVDVTVPRRLRPRDGIRPHLGNVPEDEREVHARIPVTSVPRTLLDLATILQPHELKRAAEQAEALGHTAELSINAVVQRHAGRHGARALRELGSIQAALPRSELERRFLTFIDETGLPQPQVNRWLEIQGELIQADCAWPAHRLIVEIDSRTWHTTKEAFERDRRRDRRCLAAGWRVYRVTESADAAELEPELRALLTAAPAPPS
jgi:very-short-patch-repair endonuclease